MDTGLRCRPRDRGASVDYRYIQCSYRYRHIVAYVCRYIYSLALTAFIASYYRIGILSVRIYLIAELTWLTHHRLFEYMDGVTSPVAIDLNGF